jgi:HPt (histidine-containing phosphotransfer) domain-containing protein
VQSADEPDDALSSILAGLAVSARQANLARSDVLAGALAAVAAGRLEEAERERAEQAAHQVVGSAGTFGSARASELAALLEEYFAGKDAARAAGLAQARTQLDELRRELVADHQVEE